MSRRRRRNQGFQIQKGYDLSGYDKDLVRQAQAGSRWDHNDQARYDKLIAERKKAKEKAKSYTKKKTKTSTAKKSSPPKVKKVVKSKPPTKKVVKSKPQPKPKPKPQPKRPAPVSNQSKKTSSDFNVGGDLKQNIGKQGDMTTTIGDNNQFGAGTSIGNDYSVTIGNQNAGNVGAGGTQGALANMQSAAAYSALNNNAWAKSRSQLNGYGRSAGAIEEAAKTTGVKNRVASLYNLTGMDQKYWNNKATAQQGGYLGDMFNFRSPSWTMPSAPEKPEDKTQDIAKKFNP